MVVLAEPLQGDGMRHHLGPGGFGLDSGRPPAGGLPSDLFIGVLDVVVAVWRQIEGFVMREGERPRPMGRDDPGGFGPGADGLFSGTVFPQGRVK